MKAKTQISLGDFHFGNILKAYIKSRKITKAVLARKINRDDSTILYYQKTASLQLAIVLQLSHAVKHNFFADIAAMLPATYKSSVLPETDKDERIAQLEQELALVKAEKEILLKALQGS